jgi:hypothetical protein
MIARKRERILFLAMLVGMFILFLLEKCSSEPKPDGTDGHFVIHTVDTVFRKGKTDTIRFTDTISTQIVKYKYIDTTTEDNLSVRIYHSEIDDSLISGDLSTTIELPKCTIIDQNFDYTPKFPKYITRVDTLIIDKETVKEQVRNKVFVGAEVGGNMNTFSIGPKISLKTKKDILYNYRYDVILNTHNIGVSFKITNPFKK